MKKKRQWKPSKIARAAYEKRFGKPHPQAKRGFKFGPVKNPAGGAMKNSGGLFLLLGLGAVAYIWYQSSAVSSTVGSAANTANLLASAANPNAVPTVVSSTPIPFQATPGTGVGQLIYGPSIEQLTGAGA